MATFERAIAHGTTLWYMNPVATTASTSVWVPAAAAYTIPAAFPDSFEVRVFVTTSGLTLVVAVELIRPGNKDHPDARRVFVTKCASCSIRG